jgi:hypothetical protein
LEHAEAGRSQTRDRQHRCDEQCCAKRPRAATALGTIDFRRAQRDTGRAVPGVCGCGGRIFQNRARSFDEALARRFPRR